MHTMTDWNCHLLPMMQDLIRTPQEAVEALELLKTRSGITHYCMMPEFDCSSDSVAAFLLRRERSMRDLNTCLHPCFSIKAAASVKFLPELSKMLQLQKLCLPKTSYLPLSLPVLQQPDWFARELNQMLYHCKQKILFLSFDLYRFFYPSPDLKRLSELKNVAYQFSYQSLTDPTMRDILKALIRRNAPILFGTAVNSYGKAAYYEFDCYMQAAEEHFSSYERDVLFFNDRIFRK